MDSHMNFEYLCRVCAANTKGRQSVAECVYILKTDGLKDKIFKYLSITVNEGDLLPKVLCKTCFRQVEQTASLSSIAKHTQEVFEEFVRFNKPRKPAQPERPTVVRNENQKEVDFTPLLLGAKTPEKNVFNAETTSRNLIDLSMEPKKSTAVPAQLPVPAPAPVKSAAPTTQPPSITPPHPAAFAPVAQQPQAKHVTPDEVVVHVSVAEPFTQQTQRKMISASKRRESIPPDMRFAPKSIAQRPLATKQPEISLIPTQPTPPKKISPPAVLSFSHGQNSAQQTSKITVNSFALERVPSATTITPNITINNSSNSNNNNSSNNNNNVPPPLPEVTVQKPILGAQKRKSTKPLSVLRTNGQVSLLKKSQKPVTEELPVPTTKPAAAVPATVVTTTPTTTITTPSITTKLDLLVEAEAEELPDKIIIAATKNQKQQQKQKHSKPTAPQPPQKPPKPAAAAAQKPSSQPTPQQQATAMSILNPAMPNDILLGKVIRDADLLKLILKALKWPVDNNNMETQMNRLRNSKFSSVMSDNNLLQDTDLTQLLGPYLAPVLLAAHVMQQQQQQMAVAAATAAVNAASMNQNVPIIPYKLPPETSVQLVPASPTEESPSKKSTPSPPPIQLPLSVPTAEQGAVKPLAQRKRTKLTTKQRNNNVRLSLLKQTEILVAAAAAASARRSFPPSANIDVTLVNKPGIASLTEPAAAAAAGLKQKSLLKRKQRPRKRRVSVHDTPTDVADYNENGALDIDFDLDNDIVLMEPDEPIGMPNTATTTTTAVTNALSSIVEPLPIGDSLQNKDITLQLPLTPEVTAAAFTIPQPTPRPLITRPIIKRRRTVIQRANVEEPPKPAVATAVTVTNTKAAEETAKPEVATPKEETPKVETTNVNTVITTTKANSNEAPTKPATARKPVKSALGKQLLQAIGLQKLPASTSDNAADTAAELLSTRESVQQIRAALKRSLKQAQEQRKRNKVEPVKQDADSTTKTTTTTKTNDKVAIEVIELDEQGVGTSSAKQEKQQEAAELDGVSAAPKTPELRGKTENSAMSTARSNSQRRGRQRKEVSYAEIEENDMKTIQQVKDEINVERTNQSGDNVTSSDLANKDDMTPRRRGRKRKDDNDAMPVDDAGEADKNETKVDVEIPEDKIKKEAIHEVKDTEKSKETLRDSSATRPKRVVKTNPKFYKSPVKQETTARRSILTRSRNRN